MRIVIGLPTPESVSANFSLHNLPAIIAKAKEQLPDVELFIQYKTGVMTSSNRNFIVNEALKINADAILWLDTDMIYPVDIISFLWNSKKDIIGSVYFKRSPPYDPVLYVKSKSPTKPYAIVDPLTLSDVTEVDGIGFGGMMVRMNVYQKMSKLGMWHHYGRYFGYPVEMEDQLSHDLVFCQEAQKMGYKIYVHPKVRCGHIEERLITAEHWNPNQAHLLSVPKIAVIIPSIDTKKAQKTLEQLQSRAGFEAEYYIVEDVERTGYMATINGAVRNIEADYYVYTAEDAYSGRNWLYFGIYEMLKKNAGLLAFNDGKNNGLLATFGMVSRRWLSQNYNGDLFYSGYKSHYGDTELTMLAMGQGKLAYSPESVLVEVDYNKHGVNLEDKKLYNIRKKSFINCPDLFS